MILEVLENWTVVELKQLIFSSEKYKDGSFFNELWHQVVDYLRMMIFLVCNDRIMDGPARSFVLILFGVN